MFRNKSEVDKNVSALLYKAKNEHERNLRCFHIAQLYYKIQDYESVQRYVTMYLSVRDDSSSAHKLLGQAFEGLGQKNKAIDAYTKSLKVEPDQSDLILRICDLLCDKDIQFDPVLARYWADRAASIFPHSAPVFMLKEKLLSTDSNLSSKDLEELLHAELKAKPMDLTVRIKLLKLYVDSGRTEMALKNAFEVENRQSHVNSIPWYQCIHNICKTYHRENPDKCDGEFYVHWLTALDRMCSLSTMEKLPNETTEVVNTVYSFDQAIYIANHSSKKSDLLQECLKHVSAQLPYHIGNLLIKLERKQNTSWKETKRIISPLFLLASTVPSQSDQSWTFSLNSHQKKLIQHWVHQNHCRIVQSGHLLLSLVKENHSEKVFLDRVNHFISSDWKRIVYEKVFEAFRETNSLTSHFLTGGNYAKVPLKIPSNNTLKPSSFVGNFEYCYFGSLHHLTWLGLRALKKTNMLDIKLPTFHTTSFKSLQLTINNLNNVSVETLNQLDVDSFLYATVFSTGCLLSEQHYNLLSEDRPDVLPADVSAPLTSTEQDKWWSNVCSLFKGTSQSMSPNESMSDIRFSLQRGLEVVRGEGLSTFLIVALARTFASRATLSNGVEEHQACHARALHLWNIAYPRLETLVSKRPIISTFKAKSTLFEYPENEISLQEAKLVLEEAKFFLGCHYMNNKQYEKAIEEFKSLRSPQALFNLATVYQKWAEDQVDGVKGEEITSEIRCRHIVLATKARELLQAVKSLIKNDVKDPLHTSVDAKMFDVEDMLKRVELENGASERDINGTFDGSNSYESGASPIREAMNILASANQRTRPHTSTPRRTQEQKVSRFNMSELIDLLSVQQSTNQLKMQQILEQIRLVLDKTEMVVSEQRSQKNLVESLNARLNNFETEIKSNLSDLKKDIKRPDLCNVFDEDDYTDEMLQYQTFPQYYNTSHQRLQLVNPAPNPSIPHVNPQYFSPRIDPLCQGFYNQQGALPFSEGQQLPDFLRQSKVSQPVLHTLQAGVVPPPLNLTAGIPGPSRIPVASSGIPSGLITTSGSMSSLTPSVSTALNVKIPTNQSGSSAEAPHNFQIPLPLQPKPIINIEERVVDEETPPPMYDPLPDYKPIVPLPDEIEIRTGEENEEVLFEKRAKLFRFIDKAWKERGIGNIKILKDKSNGKVRILMRREQVHKICANHFLTSDMALQPKSNSENAWIWYANDFADEKVQFEQFCIKFKTNEESKEFKYIFDQAVEELKVVKDVPHPVERDQTKAGEHPTLEPYKHSAISNFIFPSICSTTTTSNVFSVTKPSNSYFDASSGGFFSNSLPSNIFSSSAQSSVITTSVPSSFPTPVTNVFASKTSYTSKSLPLSVSNTKENSSQSCSSQEPIKLGGLTFSLAEPKFKVPDPPKPEKEVIKSEPSPFSKFNLPVTSSPKDAASIFRTIAVPNTSESSKPFSGLFGSITSKPVNNFSLASLNQITTSSTETAKEKNTVIKPDSVISETPGIVDSLPNEEDPNSFVPTATFEPVVPLPKEIDIKTGEENEEIVFEDRAQLFRYCKETKKWKERGIGQMKILKHKESGAVRFLMRREKVLKVCCNHRITKDILLKPATSSASAFTWAAKDYSEDEPANEIFSLKFKTSDQAEQFKQIFDRIQSELTSKAAESGLSPIVKSTLPPLSDIIKKEPDSWECSSCYVRNKKDRSVCSACSASKPGRIVQPSVRESDKGLPKEGNIFGPISPNMINKSPGMKGICTKQFDEDNINKPLRELLKPESGSWECKTCYIRNKPEVELCPACKTDRTGSAIKGAFNFGVPSPFQQTPNNGSENSSTNATEPVGFSLGLSCFQTSMSANEFVTTTESLTGSKFNFAPAKFTIGTSSPKESVFGVTSVHKEPVFGVVSSTSSTKSGFDFSTPCLTKPNDSSDSGFGSKTFQFSLKLPDVSSPPGNKSLLDESYDPEEEQDHVQYQPVVPLPDKIDVITGEEDENILYSQRAKLYRFDTSTKEWKERGLGDIKILQHKETGKIRFLMRRETVMKVCLNHFITDEITLRPKDDKSWLWFALDYAEGTQSNEQFVIRFKNVDIAQEFKTEFEKAKILLSKKSSALVPASICDDGSGKETNTENSSTSSDSDIEFVSEHKASPELMKKALSLQLPASFYLYLDKLPCPGCVGCDSEEKENEIDEVTTKKNKEKIEDSSSSQKSVDPIQGDLQAFVFGIPQPPAGITPTIFGNTPAPKSAGFTFAKEFNSSSAEPTSETINGVFFQGKSSFTENIPQTSIFPSAVSNSNSQQSSPAQPFSNVSNLPSFGTLASTGDQSTIENAFGNTDSVFSTSQSIGGGLTFASDGFKWDGAGTQLFSSVRKTNATSSISKTNVSVTEGEETDGEGEAAGEDGSKEDHDPHFEPLIPLPAKIEVVTGEENEDILFSERATLYRFHSGTKEWKERGVGEMKILAQQNQNKYRLLMRREKVHKIVCNHFINQDFELTRKTDKAYSWFAMNFCDGENTAESLCVKFKTEELAQKFKEVVEDCVAKLIGGHEYD